MKTKTIKKTSSWGREEEYEVNELGQKHGQYKSWHENGNIWEECTYQNGKLHGLYKQCLTNGMFIFIDTNKKGQEFGTRIEFKYE